MDIKVLSYSRCPADASKNTVTLKKWGVNSSFEENKELEGLLLPYLIDGYKITHFNGDINSCTIFLQKD